ncbi:MAG: VanZ family protein, partial [Planctomycetes bacterium]|nr:VanZ family protein [Planctomycetota bacterium]
MVRVPVAVLAGITVSLLAEGLQTTLTIRVAALTDVALNTVGALLGAMLAATLYASGNRVVNRCRQDLIERPLATQTQWLTIGLLLFCLAPFDFVLDSAALHDSFRAARWDLSGIRSAGIGEPPFGLFVSQLSTAACFSLLG